MNFKPKYKACSQDIADALKLIFEGIAKLKQCCGSARNFTIDGRLVGDIGEIIAEREFEIKLDNVSRPEHDARTLDGRDVQIKATFQNSLTFRKAPVLYLGIKLYEDGSHEVIFNGPGSIIAREFEKRKGLGTTLLSFPIKRLKELSESVVENDRVPLRKTDSNA